MFGIIKLHLLFYSPSTLIHEYYSPNPFTEPATPETLANASVMKRMIFCKRSFYESFFGLVTVLNLSCERDFIMSITLRNIIIGTRVKTHKLLQVCKQVVTSLFTSC